MTSSREVNNKFFAQENLAFQQLEVLKNHFLNVQNYKRRFFYMHEAEIYRLKEDFVREKALYKEVNSEYRTELKKIKKVSHKQITELKQNYNYKIYELKKTESLEIDKIKHLANNYLSELRNAQVNLVQQLKLLGKNKEPEDLKAIENLENLIDRLKLSAVSIKIQFKNSLIREKALLHEKKDSFLTRKRKLKIIKERLIKERNLKIEGVIRKINSHQERIKEIKAKEFSYSENEIKNIEEQLAAFKEQETQFNQYYQTYYSSESKKITHKYQGLKEVVEKEFNEQKAALLTNLNKELNQYQQLNNKRILKQRKNSHKENYKTSRNKYRALLKEVRIKEKKNSEETKKYLQEQQKIKQEAQKTYDSVVAELYQQKQIYENSAKEAKLSQEHASEFADLKNTMMRIKENKKSTKKIVFDQKRTKVLKKINSAYFFVAPAAFGALVFTILPVVFMLIAAFFKVDIVNLQKSQFVGFMNFYEIFKYDVQFRQSLVNTLIYALITIGLLSVVTLSMAAWLSKNTKIHNAVTTMVFTPHIASLVAISILWIALLSPSGIINQLLAVFGIQGPRWLLQENTSLFSVSMVTVWKDIGYYVLLIIAGLQSIPTYVYEAAKLDKASKTKTFFKITVPLLAPTLSFVFVNKFINSFKVFAPIEIMTNGGPMGSSTVLSYWIYKVGRLGFNYGHAMAGAIILIMIISFFTIINFKFFNRKIEY